MHVALVYAQAGPLAGDHDALRIVVGPGASLVVTAVAGTVALPGGEVTRLETDALVAARGRLVLDDPVTVVTDGALVRRRTRVELEQGAVAAVREAVVLGRTGERPGVVDAQLNATLGGSPLLEDALRIDPACDARHVALPPGHRAVVSAAVLGARESAGLDDRELLHCALPGTLRRATGEDLAAAESACAAAWTAFRGVVAVAAGDTGRSSVRAEHGPRLDPLGRRPVIPPPRFGPESPYAPTLVPSVPSLERSVLFSPNPVARAAARMRRNPHERWILGQPRAVRASFVDEVLDGDSRGRDRRQQIWMLRQPNAVRESFVREVLGHE